MSNLPRGPARWPARGLASTSIVSRLTGTGARPAVAFSRTTSLPSFQTDSSDLEPIELARTLLERRRRPSPRRWSTRSPSAASPSRRTSARPVCGRPSRCAAPRTRTSARSSRAVAAHGSRKREIHAGSMADRAQLIIRGSSAGHPGPPGLSLDRRRKVGRRVALRQTFTRESPHVSQTLSQDRHSTPRRDRSLSLQKPDRRLVVHVATT